MLAQRKIACARSKLQLIRVNVLLFTGEFWHFCWSIMITSIRGSIHQGHEAFSEHSRGRQCAFMSLATLLFNRSNSVDLWTQTNIDDILFHRDRMYLHALTNKMVPDANSLLIEELPEVAGNLAEQC